MKNYEQEIDLYFELKGTPDSSRESYLRRMHAFINFMQARHKCMTDVAESDIQQYILYLKKEKGLSAGTINNYISAIRFFYTHVLGRDWNPKKIPRMRRILKLKYLGAQVGFFSLLHTWAQDLHYHPHIHTVVLAGGLTKLNQWRNSSKKFFIPVKVLSKKFRGKFLHYLKQYYRQNLLKFYGNAQKYQQPKLFRNSLKQCYAVSWYSYTKETFSGPLAVVQYLGRYTHRIAISNSRIVSMDEHTVTITVKDRKCGNQTKNLTLTGVEFIRRFLRHVLPKGFVKIRHYGLLANRNKKTKLALSRKLTCSPVYKAKFEGLETIKILCILVGRDVMVYPVCMEGKLRT